MTNVLEEGGTFGSYRIESLLGRGGMATVYRAVAMGAQGFQKPVALKILDPKITEDNRFIKALINEARLGGRLKHPNIVEVYAFDHVDHQYYLAMELVEGWTLDQLLRRSGGRTASLPLSVAVEILQEICKGLAYLHSLEDHGAPMHLVHRDIKPANIMVSRAGEVKILDFGIAKSESNLYKTTAADVTKGTPVYMSPEQVRGENLDGRSDLFALGVILHELLTGHVLLSGGSLLEIMNRVLACELPKVRQAFDQHHELIRQVLDLTVRHDRGKRFATANDLRCALKQIAVDGPSLRDWLSVDKNVQDEALQTHLPVPGPTRAQIEEVLLVTPPPIQPSPVSPPQPVVKNTTEAPRRESSRARIGGLALLVILGVIAYVFWPLGSPQSNGKPSTSPTTTVYLPGLDVLPNLTVEPGPAPTPPLRAPSAPVVEAPVGTGTLVLNSRPWARVEVDGQDVGMTPIRDYTVSAGTHDVVFHCGACSKEQEKTQTMSVTVGAGETVTNTSVRF